MNLLQKFKYHIKDTGLFQPEDGLLLAVSGGIDSVTLAWLCKSSGYRVEIAHMNFRLRGEESDRDEKFVRQLANQLQMPLHLQRTDAKKYASDNTLSIQESARVLRYTWFHELLQTNPQLRYLCTAHHADDNTETVLMNLFRGTGIAGLKGIRNKQDNIIRPLLFASRKEIEAYAVENRIQYVEDSSNREEKYIRNFFRLQVIPLIEKVYPAASENMRHNIARFNDLEKIYQEAIDRKKKKLMEHKAGEWHVPVGKLRNVISLQTIVYELFSPFGFSAARTDEIVSLMDSETGRYLLSSTHRLLKNRKWFIITPVQRIKENTLVIDHPPGEWEFGNNKISIREMAYDPGKVIPADPGLAWVDFHAVTFPLIIRKWKEGDYFYPLGMRKKKKLSRFFIDRKLSIPEKENTWVLESSGRIVWVIGQRIDDRYKLTPHAKKILSMRVENYSG